jgi:hypothetical protein
VGAAVTTSSRQERSSMKGTLRGFAGIFENIAACVQVQCVRRQEAC